MLDCIPVNNEQRDKVCRMDQKEKRCIYFLFDPQDGFVCGRNTAYQKLIDQKKPGMVSQSINCEGADKINDRIKEVSGS